MECDVEHSAFDKCKIICYMSGRLVGGVIPPRVFLVLSTYPLVRSFHVFQSYPAGVAAITLHPLALLSVMH